MPHQLRAYIALGANLGEPLKQLDSASESLGTHPQINRVAMSTVYQSVPHGDIGQPDYHNAVMSVDTTLSPKALLAVMHAIEADNGRERKIHWGARTLDLDLILYADTIMDSDDLTVPHPRAHEREFVVKPLCDLDKKLIIPPHGCVTELLDALPIANLKEVRNGTTYHD